jgi:hypothetical protein
MSPDFPKPAGGGATAAEVWSYTTRALNSDTANAIRDAILSDANKIAGGNIDAAISTRASITGLALVDADVLTRSTLTQGQILADATPIYGARIDGNVTSRAAAADYTSSRAAKMDKIQDFLEEAFGTLTADGSEQTVKEIITTVNKLHAFIDLTNLAGGDTIVVRQFMKIKTAGTYIKYAEETYSGAQSLPMLYIQTKPAKYGIKITLQQTGGTNRTYDWQSFQERAAT